MLTALALLAAAADEPCYGHAFPDRVSGDRFWVEWDEGAITEAQAVTIRDAAEAAWHTYHDDLGWKLTDGPIVIAVTKAEGQGFAGLTRTSPCDDGPHPRIELFVGMYRDEWGVGVTSHEVAHAAQYAYMGAYLDSVTSWLWWMEGTASWLTVYADGDQATWAYDAQRYLDNPQIALHHGIEGYLNPDTSDHMYGTAILARFLDENYGGTDIVRATWEYGETQTGVPIFFPDAVAGAGLDFEEVWPRFLVTAAVGGMEGGDLLDGIEADEPSELPASGGRATADEGAPEGLGWSAVRFRPSLGSDAIDVTFEGADSVGWIAALARTSGDDIEEILPLEVGPDGRATGTIGELGGRDAWLVVSPLDREPIPRSFTWTAEEGAKKGCSHTGGGRGAGGVGAGVLLGILAIRRTRTGIAARRR